MGAGSGLVARALRRARLRGGAHLRGATGSAVLGFAYLFVFSSAHRPAGGGGTGERRGGGAAGAGAWTVWVRRAGGVVLLGMAEYYFIRMGSVL
jgi:hypothetical protein